MTVSPARKHVPFSDLSRQWKVIGDAIAPDLQRIFDTSAFVLGPAVEQFERKFSAYTGARHTVGVNSGTSALHLALLAAGIRRGDKVLLPAHTFVATAWAAVYIGAEVVLCDVERDTGNIDVGDAARRLKQGAKAIVPVHLYGQPANMAAVLEFARAHDLTVIEDAAQAHAARYDGRHAGTIGRFGCFSFYPGKNLGAAGEAGAICTDDDAAAERMRALRNHGQNERYVHDEVGYNYRMEGIQGLVLDHKLRHLDDWTAERKRIAQTYLAELASLPLELPRVVHHDHVYHLFVVRTPQRDALRAFLAEQGIETGLHYPVPLHRQPCFAEFPLDRTSYPVADHYADECLSLPIFVGMTDDQLTFVIENVRSFFARS